MGCAGGTTGSPERSAHKIIFLRFFRWFCNAPRFAKLGCLRDIRKGDRRDVWCGFRNRDVSSDGLRIWLRPVVEVDVVIHFLKAGDALSFHVELKDISISQALFG